jgi:SNF family Na+-dependent transporter
MPRLAGVGWVASFSGIMISLIYTLLLGLNLYYMFISGSEPWLDKNYTRIKSCDTAYRQSSTSTELFLYLNVTKVLDEKTCDPFEDGYDEFKFNGPLYIGVLVTWIIAFSFIVKGIKSISIGVALLVPFSFISLFILMGHYISMNNSVGGKGPSFYMGSEALPFP